jgi:hypothetical protein
MSVVACAWEPIAVALVAIAMAVVGCGCKTVPVEIGGNLAKHAERTRSMERRSASHTESTRVKKRTSSKPQNHRVRHGRFKRLLRTSTKQSNHSQENN